jgi:CubicO group peptidase (beta-lactamase class C family)
MWWVAVDGKQFDSVNLGANAYSAQGGPGQLILVMPSLDTVLVHLYNTDGTDVSKTDSASDASRLGNLLRLILDAAPNTFR